MLVAKKVLVDFVGLGRKRHMWDLWTLMGNIEMGLTWGGGGGESGERCEV